MTLPNLVLSLPMFAKLLVLIKLLWRILLLRVSIVVRTILLLLRASATKQSISPFILTQDKTVQHNKKPFNITKKRATYQNVERHVTPFQPITARKILPLFTICIYWMFYLNIVFYLMSNCNMFQLYLFWNQNIVFLTVEGGTVIAHHLLIMSVHE